MKVRSFYAIVVLFIVSIFFLLDYKFYKLDIFFFLLAILGLILALIEISVLMETAGYKVSFKTLLFFSLLFFLGIKSEYLFPYFQGINWYISAFLFFYLAILHLFFHLSFESLLITLFLFFYITVCSSFIYQIKLTYGLKCLILFISIVKGCDAGAYFIGTWCGKRKVFKVSPNKSLEGVGGGLLFAIVFGIIINTILEISSIYLIILASVLIGISGIVGDLFESSIKRMANVKDSGMNIPGLGGILDMVDSLILSAPLAYLIFRYIV